VFSVIARSDSDEQSMVPKVEMRIASRSLSSGAHSRDPLARNDELAV
jgi:predicted GTPase